MCGEKHTKLNGHLGVRLHCIVWTKNPPCLAYPDYIIKYYIIYTDASHQTVSSILAQTYPAPNKDYIIYTDASHQTVSAILTQTHPDPTKDYIIYTDASHHTISAILAQNFTLNKMLVKVGRLSSISQPAQVLKRLDSWQSKKKEIIQWMVVNETIT